MDTYLCIRCKGTGIEPDQCGACRWCDGEGEQVERVNYEPVRAEDLPAEQLIELAKRSPPPQEWYDEDFSWLRNLRRLSDLPTGLCTTPFECFSEADRAAERATDASGS